MHIEEHWREMPADYLVQSHLARAMHYLARIIDAPPSLFDEIFAEERRMAWLLRINLLLQHRRYREALVCERMVDVLDKFDAIIYRHRGAAIGANGDSPISLEAFRDWQRDRKGSDATSA